MSSDASTTPAADRPATTDPQDELFALLDADGEPTGAVKPRGQVHRDGDWHGALHIWVGGVGADGAPFVLFQRRSATKDTFANALDVAVGGHLRAGESVEASLREAEEELGLQVTPADAVRLGRRFVSVQLPPPEVPEQELQEVFAIRSDADLASGAYRLHPEELSGLVRVCIDDMEALLRRECEQIPASEWCNEQAQANAMLMTLDDFPYARRTVEYPLLALTSLRAVLRGETPEAWVLREVLR